MNLYAYAGNNPVAFTDPFGLCEKPAGVKKGTIGICIETFIGGKLVSAIGGGDNRSFASNGGTYRTSDRFTVKTSTGAVSGNYSGNGIGKTFGRFQGTGHVGHTSTSTDNGTTVNASAHALNGLHAPPLGIDYHLQIDVSKDGKVRVSGTHDGYPSYEGWVYEEGKDPRLVHKHESSGNMGDLAPPEEITVP